MSPVLSIISGSTFTAPTLVLPSSSVTASELPSVTSRSGSDKGLFEPPQPLTPSQILHPVHSPAPDQNPFPASDMGLSFLGIMLIVGVFLAGMLMLASKCWGKREAKKALERMQKDEEAQAQADNTSTYETKEKVEHIKHIDNIPAITVSENDQKEQFIIGESESTDITTMNIDEEDEKHEDPTAFYNAKRSGIIGASAVYSVDIPTVNKQDIPSASVLFATKELTYNSTIDTQPLQTNAEEDITDTAATKIASLESIDAVGELFLRSETSTESLSQKSDKKDERQSSSHYTQHTLALNASDYYTIFKNTATVNVAKLSNPPPRPSRKNTPALYEEDISISELDCFLTPEPSIKLNPNPPQKYAADFEAYCRERATHAAASKADSTTASTTEEKETGITPTSPILITTIHIPFSPLSMLEKDMPAIWQDHASEGQRVPKLKPALKSALKSTSYSSPTPTRGSPSKATPQAATATYLTVPKISMRTGRMEEPAKADTRSTTMSKRRARSTTIIAPRGTLGKVGLDARGAAVAGQNLELKGFTGRVRPDPSTPKRSLVVMSPIHEITRAETTRSDTPIHESTKAETTHSDITNYASPSDHPLKTMNANTTGSVSRAALTSKNSFPATKANDMKGLSTHTGNNQENIPAHPSSPADTALRRISRTTSSSLSAGLPRASSTLHVNGAQARSSSSWR